jgi:hypothetical protein
MASNNQQVITTVVTTYTQDIATLQSDVITIEGDVTSVNAQIGALESAQFITEGEVNTLQSDMAAMDVAVDNAVSQVSLFDSRLDTLESTATSLDSRLDTAESDINTAQSDINSLETAVDLINAPKLELINFKSIAVNAPALAAASTTNVEALQAWSDGGWKNDPAPFIDLRGKRVPINDTWTMGQMNGMLLLCTGGTEYHSENQFGSGATLAENVGGPNSALVWTDKTNLTGPMLVMDGNFAHIEGVLCLQGNFDYDDPQDVKDDSANRKALGMQILGRDVAGACPTGKFTGNITCMGLVTGIETVDTPYEDAADQLHLGRCFSHYCDTFFKSGNIQTLGNEFGYFDQLYTPTGFHYARGGMHTCRQHVMQGGCDYGLVITGNDTNIFGTFDTDKLIMDGTSEPDAYALYVDPVGGYVAPYVRMRLDISPNITNRKSNPIIRIRFSYGQYDFSNSNFLYERCIHVQDGVSGFFPTIRIRDACFHQGSDMNSIRKLFTVSSRGYVNIIFADNTEKYGSGGSANAGKTYDAYRNLINITGDGNSDFTVI